MPKYLIERKVPGAGKMTPADLKAISQKSNGVLATLGGRAQWLESYVTSDDKIICVYIAKDEAALREHAKCGGFPLDLIHPVHAQMDPTTGGA